MSGKTSIRFSQVPDTAYPVQTNFDTFCIIIKPRQTDGCLRTDGGGVITELVVGEGGESAEVSGDGGELKV